MHFFFCFKQLPLNFKQKFEFPYDLIDGERLLSVVVGVVSFSVDKPLEVKLYFKIEKVALTNKKT